MKISLEQSKVRVSDAQRAEFLAAPGFGKYFTDHMLVAEWNAGSGWSDAIVKGYGPLSLDPAEIGRAHV